MSKAEIKKREILESFYDVLVDEGLEGASMAKIADRLGINTSLIYHYFPNKEEMIVELVGFILAGYRVAFLPKINALHDPSARLRTLVGFFFSDEWLGLVDAGAFFSCFALQFRNNRVRESFGEMYATLRGLLIEELRAYLGEDVDETNLADAADMIIAIEEGFCYYTQISGKDGQMGRLKDNLERSILDMIEGLKKDGRVSGQGAL